MNWSKSETDSLLLKMRQSLPNDDTDHYLQQIERVDWEEVKFGIYTGQDCKAKWNQLMKKVRCHRTLSELISDAQKLVDKKKPMPPFMSFFLSQRQKYSEKNPELKCPEIARRLGKKYSQLPRAEKEIYVKKYEEEKKAYRASLGNKITTEAKKVSSKNASQSFLHYFVPERKKFSENDTSLRRRCKNLALHEKQKSGRKKNKNIGVKVNLRKELDSEYKEGCDKKVKLAFDLYVKEHFNKLVYTKDSEKKAIITKLWNSLDDDERMLYVKRAAKLNIHCRKKLQQKVVNMTANSQ